MDQTPRVVLVGRASRGEFRPVVETLELHVKPDGLQRAASIAAIRDASLVDLVVVCQSWPGEFARADVQRLASIAPMARWVCCSGEWCESDGRNSNVWPTVVRVPARSAHQRVLLELSIVRGKTTAMPLTAGREDAVLLAADVSLPSMSCRSNCVLVDSVDTAFRDGISKLVEAHGFHIVTDAATSAARSVVVVDGDPWSERTADRIGEWSQGRGQHVVVLMSLPRAGDVDKALNCGAHVVVPKLDAWISLPAALARLTSRRHRRGSGACRDATAGDP